MSAEIVLFDLIEELPHEFPGTPTCRVWKDQLYCRKCKREVKETQQTGLQCGRRIILCHFFCHGEEGELRICEDQLRREMVFEVFDGALELRGGNQPVQPKLTDSKPAVIPPVTKPPPGVIDIEAEVL